MVGAIRFAALILVFAVAGTSSVVAAQHADFDEKAYVDRAIVIARENALTADKVDWESMTAEMHARVEGAEHAYDVYPALVYLLDQLKDDHSFLQLSSEIRASYEAAKGKPFEARSERKPGIDSRFSRRRGVSSADLAAGAQQARWIVVPSFSGNADAIKAFANKLYSIVTAEPAACGFILDFRGNGGGNMWPMLAGLTPLLENGELGFFVNKEGRSAVFHRNGEVGMRSSGEEQVLAAVPQWADGPKLFDAPVAVLIDGGSGSSGEIVPIVLVGRQNTRFFGTPTHGASTSTEGFQMPDGANLVIATGGVTDRNGMLYERGLAPDEHVEIGLEGEESDAQLDAAGSWLAISPACTLRTVE